MQPVQDVFGVVQKMDYNIAKRSDREAIQIQSAVLSLCTFSKYKLEKAEFIRDVCDAVIRQLAKQKGDYVVKHRKLFATVLSNALKVLHTLPVDGIRDLLSKMHDNVCQNVRDECYHEHLRVLERLSKLSL